MHATNIHDTSLAEMLMVTPCFPFLKGILKTGLITLPLYFISGFNQSKSLFSICTFPSLSETCFNPGFDSNSNKGVLVSNTVTCLFHEIDIMIHTT